MTTCHASLNIQAVVQVAETSLNRKSDHDEVRKVVQKKRLNRKSDHDEVRKVVQKQALPRPVPYILADALRRQIYRGGTSDRECLREHSQNHDDWSRHQKEARKG